MVGHARAPSDTYSRGIRARSAYLPPMRLPPTELEMAGLHLREAAKLADQLREDD